MECCILVVIVEREGDAPGTTLLPTYLDVRFLTY